MAPIPDDTANPNDHYDAAPPLDGGASPAELGGSSKHFAPSGLEIGVITGVVLLVVLTVVGIFVWRSRKNRDVKNIDSGSSAIATTIPEGASPLTDSHREHFEPMPPPKDDAAGATIKNDDLSSIEHPAPVVPQAKWNSWNTTRRNGSRENVEEHEIADRV
ncbi:uncharacterized protein F4822DRAFT_441371 [Hypoxylon trugodes]|uniref:uncharacterized protein n=1 Tax=Hypoxylon trugodes TaxID=326681 RepID=UPI002191B145|nr:uncharacterized protein F4822DRAFT_441371 [Hypoxylon trugodes]KAI1392369.1 hypothetical protein F4822DRAFT_441371 [Hypoxylon trugodes]